MTTIATEAERRRAPRSPAQRSQAPGPLRRISGPISARAVAAATAASAGLAHAPPAPTREPGSWRAPRRSSGPARRRADVRRSGRLGAFLRALPDHALLDRVVRGRAWIPILGAMLAGIVAMQVEMLKLGTTIGRSLQQTATLETRNQLLRINVASLADDQRIEHLAESMGMVMPEPTVIGFLSASGASARHVAAGIHAPEPSLFLSSLSSFEAAAGGILGSSGAAIGTAVTAATTATGTSVQPTGTVAGAATSAAQPQTTQSTQSAPPTTQSQTAATAQGSLSGQASPSAQATTPAPTQVTAPAGGTATGAGQGTSGGAAPPSGG